MKRFLAIAALLIASYFPAQAQSNNNTFTRLIDNAPDATGTLNGSEYVPVVIPGPNGYTVRVNASSFLGGGGGGSVSSVFGRTGAITAHVGDYSFSQISGTINPSTQISTSGIVANTYVCPTITFTSQGIATSAVNGTCGGGGGSGTVTSVGLTLPGIFNVTGSPVTVSGTLTASLTSEGANLAFMGPTSGAPGTPSFRAIVANDLPALSALNGTINLNTQVIGTITPSVNIPASGVVAATYTCPTVTVTAQGLITSISNGSCSAPSGPSFMQISPGVNLLIAPGSKLEINP